MSVNNGRYVPFTMVTTADSMVKPIIMMRLTLVVQGICRRQNACAGTIAKTTSVNVVYAQKPYEK